MQTITVIDVISWSPIPYSFLVKGGSMILQGRVSNSSKRGTGDRAPRGQVGTVERVPSPEKFCISYIKMVRFYAFPVIFIDIVLFKKGTLIKRAGVRTPPGSAPAYLAIVFQASPTFQGLQPCLSPVA